MELFRWKFKENLSTIKHTKTHKIPKLKQNFSRFSVYVTIGSVEIVFIDIKTNTINVAEKTTISSNTTVKI